MNECAYNYSELILSVECIIDVVGVFYLTIVRLFNFKSQIKFNIDTDQEQTNMNSLQPKSKPS